MKSAYYPILRIVLIILIGIFMIIYPESILKYIAVVIGLLLLIPGAIQLIRYLIVCCKRNRRDRRYNPMTFPFLATFCVLAGVAVIVFSQEIAMVFSLLLAAGLISAGGYEIGMIVKSECRNRVGYYLLPALLVLLGIFILVNPLDLLPKIMIIMFGVGAIIYGINEIVYLARIER